MTWQDITLSIMNIVFTVSLIPQVVHGFTAKVGPIKHLTSVPTFVGLFITSYVYLTLGLTFSMVTVSACALFWLLLFLQRIWYHQK